MTRITFAPYISLALWLTLAIASVALLAWYAYHSRRRLPARRWWAVIALMGLAVAVPLGILLNPTWLAQIPPPAGKPLLTVLVDRSASMGTRDGDNGETRYQAASVIVGAITAQLPDRYDVRLRLFAESSKPVAVTDLKKEPAEGTATDITAALEDALEDDRPQGQALLLLSDGGHNLGGLGRLHGAVAKAKATATPIYTKTLGGPTKVRDIDVSLQQSQEMAFVGQRVPVTVAIRQRGSLATTATLHLIQDGKPVETRSVRLSANEVVEETIYVSQKKNGLYCYDARVDPLPGEVTTNNNTTPLLIRVIDQPVRVLVLEGKPYWDTKFLVRTLSHDPSVELTSVVQLAEGRLLHRKIPQTLPTAENTQLKQLPEAADPMKEQWTVENDAGKFLADAKALAAYQIIILGRNAEVFLSDDALARLRKWIAESEGSLLCFRGAPASQINQRLGELMPVRWTPMAESRFRPQWTSAGQSLRWLPAVGEDRLAQLPSLATTSRAESLKALAVVLAKGAGDTPTQPSPAIVYQPVGTGRVVVVEGAGMWRWAFLPPDRQAQEEIYGSVWRSLVRWLVANIGLLPSQRWSLRADKLTFSPDENASAMLLVRDWTGDPPQLELRGTAIENKQTFAAVPHANYPGQYHAALGRLPEGRYTLRLCGVDPNDPCSETGFDVRGNLAERLDIAAQPNLMKRIAQDSGGAALTDVEPRVLAQKFDQHLHRTRPERVARTTAWDRWWILVGAVGLWAAAWSLRRSSGLV